MRGSGDGGGEAGIGGDAGCGEEGGEGSCGGRSGTGEGVCGDGGGVGAGALGGGRSMHPELSELSPAKRKFLPPPPARSIYGPVPSAA